MKECNMFLYPVEHSFMAGMADKGYANVIFLLLKLFHQGMRKSLTQVVCCASTVKCIISKGRSYVYYNKNHCLY